MIDTAQQDALAVFAGLRRDGDGWRMATAAELEAEPSALRDLRDARRRRIQNQVAFLRGVSTVDTTATDVAFRRTAEGVLEDINNLLVQR